MPRGKNLVIIEFNEAEEHHSRQSLFEKMMARKNSRAQEASRKAEKPVKPEKPASVEAPDEHKNKSIDSDKIKEIANDGSQYFKTAIFILIIWMKNI